jgi:hypothetical protein
MEMLPVKLNNPDLLERAKSIGQVHDKLQQHLLHAAEVRTQLKKEEGELSMEVDRLAFILRTGEEPRPVEVEAWADFEKGLLLEIRKDTGAVIHKRRLNDEDRQGEFDLAGWQDDVHQRVLKILEDAKRMEPKDEAKGDAA